MSLAALSVAKAAAHIREGRITSAELVADCLKRIDDVDADVQAWAFLDRDHAMRQATALDEHRRHGKPLGPLHGVPVGIKDIFDTDDMPTEFGSPVWAGRTPRADAFAVARLRGDGAVIMGKTVTTEYAYYHPGKTTNPHDPARTPAGSPELAACRSCRSDTSRSWGGGAAAGDGGAGGCSAGAQEASARTANIPSARRRVSIGSSFRSG